MNIIRLNDNFVGGLTVDSTLVTVDRTDITVDMTEIELNSVYSITITPRDYVASVIFTITNELTKVKSVQTLNVINENGKMIIDFELDSIKEGDAFSITVTDLDEKLIWRGKAYATNQTDIQEFKLNIPNNNQIIKI